MRCPTKEQVLEAAGTSREAKRALKFLFPEVFDKVICKGEQYSWGTDSDGGCGVVVDIGSHFSFINFDSGDTYLSAVPKDCTIAALNSMLSRLPPRRLHDCYYGVLKGPHHFKSWCLKY